MTAGADATAAPLTFQAVGWGLCSAAGPGKQTQDRVGADGTLFCVADGMGGMADGEVAASRAVAALHTSLPRDADGLKAALFAANSAVRAVRRAARMDTGTTLVALLVFGPGVWVVSAGDSRAYASVDGGPLVPVTADDNVATERGITMEDPQYPQVSHMITRYLGQGAVLDVDPVPVRVGGRGRVLLTSDGVHDFVSVRELRALASLEQPSEVAEALVRRAGEVGSHDDASAVVVDIEREVGDGS